MEENEETSDIRPKNAPFRGAVDGVPFGKLPQPSGEAKSRGKRKKKTLREILDIVIKEPENFESIKKIKEKIPSLKVNGLDIEALTDLVTALAPLYKKNATSDYNSIRDRLYGKPPQQLNLAGHDGGQLKTSTLDLTKLSDDDLRALDELQRKAGISEA